MNIKVFNIRLSKEHCQEDQKKMNEFLDAVEIKLTSTNFVTTSTVDFWSAVVFYEAKKIKKINLEETNLTSKEKEIYSALKKWRKDLSDNLGWSAFRVCHNSELISIAINKPQNLDDFKSIKGFGENKIANFGEDILSLLNAI